MDANGYTSIVFDILEYVEKNSDEEALQYHFADLIDDTGDSTNLVNQLKTEMPKVAYVTSFLSFSFFLRKKTLTKCSLICITIYIYCIGRMYAV